jgi:hypothetical protein
MKVIVIKNNFIENVIELEEIPDNTLDTVYLSADDPSVKNFNGYENFFPNQVLSFDNSKNPKILKHSLVDKHFHGIDHNTEIKITTKIKEVYGETQADKGLLIRKEYYSDDSLTDLLFKVDYGYQKSPTGHLTHQSVTMTWINEDGTENIEKKDKGFAAYSPQESRNATRKRRETVIYLLENSLINMLAQAPGGLENLSIGAKFLEAASPAINSFLNSGLPTSIQNFVSQPETITSFPFLQMELAPGIAVAMFIINGVTYD